MITDRSKPGASTRYAFTLTELLVVIGMIALLATLTLVSMNAIGRNARLASATNAVTAALDNARAMALKDNRVVLVVFRPRRDGREDQIVEVVTAARAASVRADVNAARRAIDRFVVMPEVPARPLPAGVKVAGPSYRRDIFGTNEDSSWTTQSHLPRTAPPVATESPGQLIGVMYAPDGTVISRNSQSDADRIFVDFDGNQRQLIDGGEIDYPAGVWIIAPANFNDGYFLQVNEDDEPFVDLVPFLAVFDDDEARAVQGDDDWSSGATRDLELTAYITGKAERIHFNRYTGVGMR